MFGEVDRNRVFGFPNDLGDANRPRHLGRFLRKRDDVTWRTGCSFDGRRGRFPMDESIAKHVNVAADDTCTLRYVTRKQVDEVDVLEWDRRNLLVEHGARDPSAHSVKHGPRVETCLFDGRRQRSRERTGGERRDHIQSTCSVAPVPNHVHRVACLVAKCQV